MPIKILMPALSPTMTEGNLAKWLKNEGDQIKSGDVIAEIETDKATMEVEAVDEGTLGKILVPGGTEGVKVNEPIALLLEEGKDKSALEGGTAAPQPMPASKGNGQARAEAEAKVPDGPASPQSGGVSRELMTEAKPASGPGGGERITASPLARRMAAQSGLDLRGLQGSGPHGRIVKTDIEAALKGGARPAAAALEAKAAPAPAPAAAPAPAPAPAAVAPPTAAYDEIPLNNMRKVIARRLTEAKQTILHFYLTVDIELDALLAMRAQLNGR